MNNAKQREDQKYLTLKALDFFHRRLEGGITTWRQLAGEMGCYCSIDVDTIEADGSKLNKSSTIHLLQDWENRRGGCDLALLKNHLERIGRRDIVRDLQDEFEKQGIDIVESRTSKFSPGTIPPEGQDVFIRGKLYHGKICMDNWEVLTPQQVAGLPPEPPNVPGPLGPTCMDGSALVPELIPAKRGTSDLLHGRDVFVSPELVPTSEKSSDPLHRRDVFVSPESIPASKRNSDPLHRRDVSPSSRDQDWGSGSLESIPSRRKDSPKNLKKIHSEVFEGKSAEDGQIRVHSVQPSVVRKEEVSYQTRRDYSSLHSRLPDSVCEASGQGGACPGKQHMMLSSNDEKDRQLCKKPDGKKYLVVSSCDGQDRQLCKKLHDILKKKGHQVFMLHEVFPNEHVRQFHLVDYVLVIYTEKYRKELKTPGTSNHDLFQEMLHEHRRNSKVNRRFIPVYDTNVIRQLPDVFLNGISSERDYILDLLSKPPRDGTRMHSSAPSQGAVGGAHGVRGACGVRNGGAMPMRGNNPALSTPEPVIVREYHNSPQNHPKPTHSDKKDQKSHWWNKKGK